MALPLPGQIIPRFTPEEVREWLSRPLPVGTFNFSCPILEPPGPKGDLVFRFSWAKDAP